MSIVLIHRSSVPHMWRQTFALVALAVWWMVLVYYGLEGLAWLLAHLGSSDWSSGPVTA